MTTEGYPGILFVLANRLATHSVSIPKPSYSSTKIENWNAFHDKTRKGHVRFVGPWSGRYQNLGAKILESRWISSQLRIVDWMQ